MATETFLSSVRGVNHTPVLTMEPFRIVEISPTVIAGSGGAIPNFSYTAYSRRGQPDVEMGDLFTDTVTGEHYRVSGLPSKKDLSFLKVQITRFGIQTP